MAMISAAPTRRLTSAVAEKDGRLKIESSTMGQLLRRSLKISRAMKQARKMSAAARSQGLFCIGGFVALVADVADVADVAVVI